MRIPWRRLAPLGCLAVLGTLLVAAQPALAAPAPHQPASGAVVPARSNQPWVPKPQLPDPVTIPGRGTKAAPFTSRLAPTAPRSMPGLEKAKGNAVEPKRATAAGTGLRRVDGPDDPYGLFCEETIQTGTSVNPDPDSYTATISYTANLGCNFYLYYAYGVAGIVDRSAGFDGTFLQVGTPFEFFQNYFASTSGGVTIPGEYYDGGRQVEVVFELYLVTPYGIPWGACNPLPGLRYLLCEGLYTDVLHIVVGTGGFGTGLNPPVVRYTSLGDSFSAGTGAGSSAYFLPPVACRKAFSAYPFRVVGQRLDRIPIDQPVHRACDGARIDNITGPFRETQPQIDNVKPYTRMVTITAGGNDFDFAEKLTDCVLGTCPELLPNPAELPFMQSRLTLLYKSIREEMRADGRLFVLNYPAFLPNPNEYPIDDEPSIRRCFGTNATITSNELRRLARATDEVNNVIAAAVAATGDPRVILVDVSNKFLGHRVCSPDPYSNGLVPLDRRESYHPNPRGHQAMAEQLSLLIQISST
jgi:lysophospholipase L1-like esterase